jgi:hypothetical protein
MHDYEGCHKCEGHFYHIGSTRSCGDTPCSVVSLPGVTFPAQDACLIESGFPSPAGSAVD